MSGFIIFIVEIVKTTLLFPEGFHVFSHWSSQQSCEILFELPTFCLWANSRLSSNWTQDLSPTLLYCSMRPPVLNCPWLGAITLNVRGSIQGKVNKLLHTEMHGIVLLLFSFIPGTHVKRLVVLFISWRPHKMWKQLVPEDTALLIIAPLIHCLLMHVLLNLPSVYQGLEFTSWPPRFSPET